MQKYFRTRIRTVRIEVCRLRQPGNFRAAIEEVFEMGSDNDSTAAILGSGARATIGATGFRGRLVSAVRVTTFRAY
jgi:hypothetical protein